jgi:hypothetical protein
MAMFFMSMTVPAATVKVPGGRNGVRAKALCAVRTILCSGKSKGRTYQQAIARMRARVACFQTSALKNPSKSDVNEYKLSRALIVKDLRRTNCRILESACVA